MEHIWFSKFISCTTSCTYSSFMGSKSSTNTSENSSKRVLLIKERCHQLHLIYQPQHMVPFSEAAAMNSISKRTFITPSKVDFIRIFSQGGPYTILTVSFVLSQASCMAQCSYCHGLPNNMWHISIGTTSKHTLPTYHPPTEEETGPQKSLLPHSPS